MATALEAQSLNHWTPRKPDHLCWPGRPLNTLPALQPLITRGFPHANSNRQNKIKKVILSCPSHFSSAQQSCAPQQLPYRTAEVEDSHIPVESSSGQCRFTGFLKSLILVKAAHWRPTHTLSSKDPQHSCVVLHNQISQMVWLYSMSCGSEPGAQEETSRQSKAGNQIVQLRMTAGEGMGNRKHTPGDSNVEPSHHCFRTEFSTMTRTLTRSQEALEKSSGLVVTIHNCSCHLHTAPPRRVREAKHLRHPSNQPLDIPLPSARIRNKPAPLWQPARTPAVCSQFPLCNSQPRKALPREKKNTQLSRVGVGLWRASGTLLGFVYSQLF